MSLFSSIGKVLGGVVKVATGVVGAIVPGPIGAIAGAANRALSGGGGSAPVPLPQPVLQMVGPAPRLAGPGTAIVRQGSVSPLGTVGLCGVGMRMKKDGGCTTRKHARMNVMNQKAANRAIRRIKGARELLQKIERQMPKRPGAKGPKRRGGCGCK